MGLLGGGGGGEENVGDMGDFLPRSISNVEEARVFADSWTRGDEADPSVELCSDNDTSDSLVSLGRFFQPAAKDLFLEGEEGDNEVAESSGRFNFHARFHLDPPDAFEDDSS